MADYSIKLGIELDTNGIQGKIDSIKTNPIKIDIDLNHTKQQIDTIKSQIQSLNNIKVNLGSASASGSIGNGIKSSVNEVNKAYSDLTNLAKRINSIRLQISGLDSSKNSKQITELSGQLNRLMTDYNNLYNTFTKGLDIKQLDALKNKINSVNTELNELRSVEQTMSKQGIDTSQTRKNIDALEKELKELQSVFKSLSNGLTMGQVDNLTNTFQATTDKISALQAKIADARAELAKSIQIKLNSSGFDKELLSIQSSFDKITNKSAQVQIAMDDFTNSLDKLRIAAKSGDMDALITANEEYERSLKKVKNQLDINTKAQRDNATALKLADDRTLFKSKVDAWLTKNSAATKKFGADLLKLKSQAENCDRTTLNHLEAEFKQVDAAAEAAGLKMQSFGDRLKTQFSKYSQYFSAASVFMYAEQGLRSMFEQVKLIDSAMTELKKVTNETDTSYNQFLTDAASKARELGTTIDGLVASTADFARLGYSFEESQGLAEVANIYAVVGDEIESVEDATKSLISTLAAFKDEANGLSNADFAMSIVDKMNEVSNNFAISSGGIGEALQRSASSMMAANNSLDETIALITAANTVVQDPERIGNAFKTVSMRIRGATTELEEAGLETDGMAESTAKLRQEILALSGVDIMLDTDTFKSTYQILDELSEKWEGLSDIAQASITELIAGKHQGNVISSLMNNFDIAEQALQTSLNSAGSAMAEHEKWQQSLEAQINKLKAAWQGLSQAFLSSNFLKVVLDGVINLVDGLATLIDTLGAFPTLMGAVAAGMSLFKNQGFLTVLNKDIAGTEKQLALFGKSIENIKTDIQSGQSLFKSLFSKSITNADIANIQAYNNLIDQCVGSQTAYYRTMQNSSSAAKELVAGANGGKVAVDKLKAASIGGKAALFGLEAAATAVNIALTMGLSFAIQLVVEGIMKLINAKKELAEEVDNLTSKFQEQQRELANLKGNFDTENESSMISRYEKLSKGVDNLGRNVSLTAEEYTEYQSIVNSIADQIPSLISGYDEQGNALLSVKGNVEALTEAYQQLIHAQNQEILTNSGKIEEDFANVVKNASGEGAWSDNHGFWAGLVLRTPFAPLLDYDLKEDTVKGIQGLLDANTSDKDKEKILEDLTFASWSPEEIRDALKNAGVEIGFFDDPMEVLKETMETNPAKIKGIVDNFYKQFEDEIKGQKSTAQALLSEAFDVSNAISGLNYGNIGEDLQAVARQTINSLDYGFFSELSKSGKTVEQWTTEMLSQLNAISKADNTKIEAAFDLQTQFNGGEISYGEYVNELRNIEEIINGLALDDKAKEQLKISLGLDDEGIVDQYDALVKRLTSEEYDFNVSTEEAENLLNGLTSEEYAIFAKVISEMSENDVEETADDIRAAIERELALQGISVKLNLEVEKANLEALSTALSESVSGMGLSETSMSAVEDIFGNLNSYDPSKLFERTANGIRLNSEEFRRLNSEYKKVNVAELNREMSSLGDIYNQTREELYRLTYGTEEYNNKAHELSSIEQQINSLEELASGYRGVASAYQEWQMTESAGSQRDMYENLISGLENIDDEISRGWFDDGTIEYLELLTGKDLSTAGIEEVKKAYKGLSKEIEHTSYNVRDFFTVDEDGNSTNTGVYNFLDAIGQMEEEKFGGKDVVQRDKKGNIIGFDFQIVGGDEVVAEALGISEELVQIMVRAADDAGFVVSMDGTYQQLDILKEKAQEAAVKMNKILEGDNKATIDIDMNVTDEEGIQTQLKSIMDTFGKKDGSGKLTGAIDMSINGADEALTVASTLQSMLDKLTRPVYMELDASQVEEELREPLQNMQEYRRLIETQNQLKLSGADTSELETSIKECKEKILDDLEEIQKNNPKLIPEIEGLKREEIWSKVETGEIKIPATIDIQLEMDEKLGILVDKALLDAGIIDKEEFEKRVNIYLNADVDNEDAKNKTEQAVNEVANNSGDKTETSVEVEVKANKIYTSDLEESIVKEVKTGAQGRLNGMGVNVKADANVEVGEVKTGTWWDSFKSWWKTEIQGKEAETVDVKADVKVDAGNVDTSSLETSLDEYQGTVEVKAEVTTVDDTAVQNYVATEKEAKGKVKWENDETLVNQFKNKIHEATGKVNWENNTENVKKNFTATGTVTWTSGNNVTVDVVSNAAGTADANGTASSGRAFARGNWGIKGNGVALGGELGQELVVRDGKFFTIGDNGAEFFKYKQNDIVFNAAQTESLFKYGGIKGANPRGKMFANGSAFSIGSKGEGGGGKVSGKTVTKTTKKETTTTTTTTTNDSSSSSDKSSSSSLSKSSSKTAEEFKETIDWIEIAIDRVERAVDRLDNKAGNVYASWSDRNEALLDEISTIEGEIELQQAAYERYMQEAGSVGLNESWAKLVREGAVDITTITDATKNASVNTQGAAKSFKDLKSIISSLDTGNLKSLIPSFGTSDGGIRLFGSSSGSSGSSSSEKSSGEILSEKISEYQDWYEKALECQDAIEELKQKEAELYAQRVENVATRYEGILSVVEHEKNMLEEYINQSEAQAWLVSAKYYDALAKNERETISELEKQKAEMLTELQVAMESGTIAQGSEGWYDLIGQIDEVTIAIAESETQLLEYAQTIQELKFEQFDLLQEKISAITEETEFLIELMSSDKLHNDNGQLTDEGKATMGLHGVNYNVLMHQADLVAEEVKGLEKELEKDPFDTDLEERYREMVALQQEYILSAQDEKEAIRDLVEEGIQLEIEALEERIDKYNEAIESQKDLYDYQKKVSEQTSEIASLQKQMAAYQGDNSEEAKAKVQELRVSLAEAEAELEETEYDKYISDTQQMLDNLTLEYSELLNMRLDNIDALISDMILQINTDATSISATLSEKADSVGYTLSSSMSSIWDTNSTKINSVITMYGERFTSAQTTTNNALNTINTNLQNMIVQLNKIANANVKSASSSSVSKSKQATATKKTTTTNKKTESTSNQNKVTNDTLMGIASAIWIYGSKAGWGNDPIRSGKLTSKFGLSIAEKIQDYINSYGLNGKLFDFWLKKGKNLNAYKYNAFESGARKIDTNQLAWTQENGKEFIVRPSDGAILTPIARGDSVLTSSASNNIWDMANSPSEFIKDNLNLGVSSVPNNSNSQSYTQILDKVVFSFPNVKNYDEMLSAMQKDRNFERLIGSMTVDRLAGKSSLAKGKSIR